MSNELLILSKSLFKSKFDIHQNEFHNFRLKIIQYFYDIYITNTANLMFETIGKSEELTKYGLYNKTIMERNFPERNLWSGWPYEPNDQDHDTQ